jgi:alkaline phosphatase D
MTRREFVASATALGATIAWGDDRPRRSRARVVERRERFAQGVASGDPHPDSVMLWTRASQAGAAAVVPLHVELAEDAGFERVVAAESTRALAEADHTCRVLVAGLAPARSYYYRFYGEDGSASRVGRTRTAPAEDDPRPARFSFVSCQNVCEGAQNAYRRMIHEDERAQADGQLDFVLHLGDFVYEVVDYPEDAPGGRRYDRKLRDLVRYPDGEKIRQGFHIAASLRDYRTLYQAYLQDPDLQDARARWPFVVMWDNHEFSWRGWQSFQFFGDDVRNAQTRCVAARQAWFEYQPARVRKASGPSLERFGAPEVRDARVERFDADGLGDEPNNRLAIESLAPQRALRFGRHLELVLTEHYTHRSQEPTSRHEADALTSPDFPELSAEELMRALDAGREAGGGAPPATLRFGQTEVANFRKDEPPQTLLGPAQRTWFLERLRASTATWKVWGNSLGTLDWRADPQNLPPGLTRPWPGQGYACFGGGDWSTAYSERARIYDAVRQAGITGFVTVSGDRHSFWAGLSAKALPPAAFEPVGVAFVTGSISAPGLVEAYEHRFPKDHPLRALYVADRDGAQHPAINLLLRHGVRSCLEYQRTGDLGAARRASNPDLAPHLSFLDMGGHGYAVLEVGAGAAQCEFVCIPRPLERSAGADGGPLRYRVRHRVALWRPGETPRLERVLAEGELGLSG